MAPVCVGGKHVVKLWGYHNAEILVTTVEHVIADIYICRIKHLIVVISFCSKVEHVEFLQVFAILERTVVYHHIQPCVCVFQTGSGILEHHFLDMLVATQASAVY